MIDSNHLFDQIRAGSLLSQVPQTPIRPPRALQSRTPGRPYYATPKTPRRRAVVKKKSNTAADVNTFFTLSSGDEQKLCVFCQYVSNLDAFLGKQLLMLSLLQRSCHAADSSYEVQYYSKIAISILPTLRNGSLPANHSISPSRVRSLFMQFLSGKKLDLMSLGMKHWALWIKDCLARKYHSHMRHLLMQSLHGSLVMIR